MEEIKLLYKIQVSGRVQGVGFRWACMKEARFRGISGYVKNMPDGSVYIEAEGSLEQLHELIKWCQRGPLFGNVENVSVETGKPSGHNSFNVRYD